MDIMKIKTKFMRTLLAKLLSDTIRKKLGYKVDIFIEEIDVQINDKDASAHLNVWVGAKVDDLKTFTKFIEEKEDE